MCNRRWVHQAFVCQCVRLQFYSALLHPLLATAQALAPSAARRAVCGTDVSRNVGDVGSIAGDTIAESEAATSPRAPVLEAVGEQSEAEGDEEAEGGQQEEEEEREGSEEAAAPPPAAPAAAANGGGGGAGQGGAAGALGALPEGQEEEEEEGGEQRAPSPSRGRRGPAEGQVGALGALRCTLCPARAALHTRLFLRQSSQVKVQRNRKNPRDTLQGVPLPCCWAAVGQPAALHALPPSHSAFVHFHTHPPRRGSCWPTTSPAAGPASGDWRTLTWSPPGRCAGRR